MLHGPNNFLKQFQSHFEDRKCTKKYPREFLQETQPDQDGYSSYKRRKPEDGGHEAIIMINGREVFVDNRWVVPSNPLLSKTFKTHINVENCSSVKSIKYVWKYGNKGFDMAVFGSQNKESNNDKELNGQIHVYI
uniref:Uncharacterized protein n=1 Tax=Lepisosteus oculatus TaxID=7918 RepID=W5LVS5_LEPOC